MEVEKGLDMSESSKGYQPPYTITPTVLNLVAEIGEIIGRYTVLAEQNLTPGHQVGSGLAFCLFSARRPGV